MLRTVFLVFLGGAVITSGCSSRGGHSPVRDAVASEAHGGRVGPGGGGASSGVAAGVNETDLQVFRNAAGDRVFFALDSYGLDDEARTVLQRQARWLADRPTLRLTVAGHADERGTREYNLALGSRRANVVRDHLISLGVRSDRISTVSFGRERPLDPRASEAGWSRNRNAHTVLSASGSFG